MFEFVFACCEQVKQKQTRVYKQLMLYRSPFYFAYSWEKELGGNHTDAWLRLRSTSYQLNITTELLRYRYIVSKTTFLPSPAFPHLYAYHLINTLLFLLGLFNKSLQQKLNNNNDTIFLTFYVIITSLYLRISYNKHEVLQSLLLLFVQL